MASHVLESLDGLYLLTPEVLIEKLTKHGIVIGGTYRHYKGGIYKVLSVGHSSEDKDILMVHYVDMNDIKKEWYRPLDHFLEKVGNVLRFKFVKVE